MHFFPFSDSKIKFIILFELHSEYFRQNPALSQAFCAKAQNFRANLVIFFEKNERNQVFWLF